MRRAVLVVMLCCATLVACGSGSDASPGPTSTTVPSPADAGADPIIQYLQESLSLLGYYEGPIDGDLSPEVREAVSAFQKDQGLPVNGTFDAATVSALAAASPEVQTMLVQALQTQLLQLGFYRGPIDGNAKTPAMTEAVKSLQRAAGIPVDGVFGQQSYVALQELYDQEIGGIPKPPPTGTGKPQPEEGDGSVNLTPAQVLKMQQRLVELGYRPGTPDGRYGIQTSSALLAFQKREGLPRNSEVTPEVLARLDKPKGAGPRNSRSGPRVEIDLDRQILFFVSKTGQVTTINTSTGSGETYTEADGSESVAYTPTGSFEVYRRVDGPDEAPLGTLYRPLYFHQGWAIHGSPVVPAYPASHGCARTADWDQDFLYPLLPNGSPVVIYGHSLGAPGKGDPGF